MAVAEFVHATHPELLDCLGGRVRLLLTGQQTDGAMTLLQWLMPVGFCTPRHAHMHEDQAIHLLEGELECLVGDTELRLRSGETLLLPRGVPHRLHSVGAADARLIVICTPAGYEEFLRAIGSPATPKLDPEPGTKSRGQFEAIVQRFGLKLMD